MSQKLLSRDPSEVSIGLQGLAAVRRSRKTAAARDSIDGSPQPGISLALHHPRRLSRLSRSGSESSICPSTSSSSDSETSNRSSAESSTGSTLSSKTSINSSANARLASEVLSTVNRSQSRLGPYWPRVILNITNVEENLTSCSVRSQQPLPYLVQLPPVCETIGTGRYRCYKNQPKSTKMKYVLEKMGSTVDICAMLNPDAEVRGFNGLTYHDLLRMKYRKEIQEVCKKPTEEISPEGVHVVRGFKCPSDSKEKEERIKKVLYPHRFGDFLYSSSRNLDLVHNHYLTDETAIPLDLLSSPPLFSLSPSPPKRFVKRRRPVPRAKQVEVVSPILEAPARRVRWKDEVEKATAGAPETKKGVKTIVNKTTLISSGGVSWQTLKE